MASLTKAFADRGDIVNMLAKNPQLGGALTGFVGTGFKEDVGKTLKAGWQKIKPIAYNAVREALSGFTKGVSESKGDLGEKVLSGLAQAGKSAGISLASDVKKQLGGQLNPHGANVAIMEGKGAEIISPTHQKSKPRIARPKLK